MPRPWQRRGDVRRVFSTRLFHIEQQTRVRPEDGAALEFWRLGCADWVNILPITAAGDVVMVRQFRYGTEAETLELPGGMIDPQDPSPAEAARRELEEETGYRAERVEPTGVIAPNPAMQSNRTHSFLARDVVQVGPPKLDGGEDIEVVTVPLVEIPERVARGEITHSLVVVAFAFALGLKAPPPTGSSNVR
jgi:8-oxo-dGTP pyrophosphatase MutT (NUDIX family)